MNVSLITARVTIAFSIAPSRALHYLLFTGKTSSFDRSCMMSKNHMLSCDIGPNDVLYGRGGATNKHRGNIRFRGLILAYQPQYKAAARADKPKIAEMIVQAVKSAGGRFLRLDASSNTLVDVEDTMAVGKTLQALRDNIPDGSSRSTRQKRSHMGKPVPPYPPEIPTNHYDDERIEPYIGCQRVDTNRNAPVDLRRPLSYLRYPDAPSFPSYPTMQPFRPITPTNMMNQYASYTRTNNVTSYSGSRQQATMNHFQMQQQPQLTSNYHPHNWTNNQNPIFSIPIGNSLQTRTNMDERHIRQSYNSIPFNEPSANSVPIHRQIQRDGALYNHFSSYPLGQVPQGPLLEEAITQEDGQYSNTYYVPFSYAPNSGSYNKRRIINNETRNHAMNRYHHEYDDQSHTEMTRREFSPPRDSSDEYSEDVKDDFSPPPDPSTDDYIRDDHHLKRRA